MTTSSGNFARANGINIHYVEEGQGVPLVLLHGGMVSTNPIWAPTPVSYAAHMQTLARRHRVIAPDTRGCGRTVHDGGTITFDQLADDVLALIEALDLDRPLIAGFSDGGITATVAGIRDPGRFRGSSMMPDTTRSTRRRRPPDDAPDTRRQPDRDRG
jgi:pimeloyl-ACP methyl ester carboxylesterase